MQVPKEVSGTRKARFKAELPRRLRSQPDSEKCTEHVPQKSPQRTVHVVSACLDCQEIKRFRDCRITRTSVGTLTFERVHSHVSFGAQSGNGSTILLNHVDRKRTTLSAPESQGERFTRIEQSHA